MGRRRARSIFLPAQTGNEHLKSAIDQAGDCLVHRLADLDISGPTFLISGADEAREFRKMVDESAALRTTYFQSDIDSASLAAVEQLFDRFEDPEAPRQTRQVPMKVWSPISHA
jgi:hypothetical protein